MAESPDVSIIMSCAAIGLLVLHADAEMKAIFFVFALFAASIVNGSADDDTPMRYLAEVDVSFPTHEVKHFIFVDEGQHLKPIEAEFKGYDCLLGFENGNTGRAIRIVCQEKGRKNTFGTLAVCGRGYIPAGLNFGKNQEYAIAFSCDGKQKP